MKKILKLFIPVITLIAGAAGGHFLKPEAASAMADRHANAGHAGAGHGDDDAPPDHQSAGSHDNEHTTEAAPSHDGHSPDASHGKNRAPKIFKFSRQFFVPLLRRGDQGDIVILTIALQTTIEELAGLEAKESLLRDAVNRRLFLVANTGGFDGNFTTRLKYDKLKAELLSALQDTVGEAVKAVLIEDIALQQG